jgi:hypothetical protein
LPNTALDGTNIFTLSSEYGAAKGTQAVLEFHDNVRRIVYATNSIEALYLKLRPAVTDEKR